ncbi:MAG: ATP-binding protein [Chloroflexota bacterium]
MIEIILILITLLITTNIWLILRIITPLRQLAARATDLESGELDVFSQPVRGIAELETLRRAIDGMVGHIRRAQEEHRSYAEIITNSQEAESQRIARDLHDDTVQALIAVAHTIEIGQTFLSTGQSERAQSTLDNARTQARDAVTGLRDVIDNLRPPALDELGLVAALRMLAGRLQVSVELEVSGLPRRIDSTEELTLYRCAQEALNNAVRHGDADHISVKVNYSANGITLTVTDDGQGFDKATLGTPAKSPAGGHYGIHWMRERLLPHAGTLSIHAEPGSGTTISVFLPTSTEQPMAVMHDPVCGAEIEPQKAYSSTEYAGQRYYFCCPVCRGAFEKDPELYLSDKSSLPH